MLLSVLPLLLSAPSVVVLVESLFVYIHPFGDNVLRYVRVEMMSDSTTTDWVAAYTLGALATLTVASVLTGVWVSTYRTLVGKVARLCYGVEDFLKTLIVVAAFLRGEQRLSIVLVGYIWSNILNVVLEC